MKKLLVGVVSLPLLALSLIISPATAAENVPLVSDDPADYTPRIQGTWKYGGNYHTVLDLAKKGEYIYAGGLIDLVHAADDTPYDRIFGNLIRFNKDNGHVDESFHPSFAGANGSNLTGQVNALEVSDDGNSLFVGGSFRTVDGFERRNLVKWDLQKNELDRSFDAQMGADGWSAVVYDLQMARGQLLVATNGTSIGGADRHYLGSVDPETGAATDYTEIDIRDRVSDITGPPRVYRIAVSPNEERALILGNFRTVGGEERFQLAMLDLNDDHARLAEWYARDVMRATTPPFHEEEPVEGEDRVPCAVLNGSCLRDIDWSPDGTWFVVGATGGPGMHYPSIKDTASRFENNNDPNAFPTWANYSGGDSIYSVRATKNYVYAGGHIRYLNATLYKDGVEKDVEKQTHYGLGAIDAKTGRAVQGWNRGKDTGRGEGWRAMLTVHRLGLFVGGDTDRIQGEPRQRLGLMPVG